MDLEDGTLEFFGVDGIVFGWVGIGWDGMGLHKIPLQHYFSLGFSVFSSRLTCCTIAGRL
jgi:hypothetical protein